MDKLVSIMALSLSAHVSDGVSGTLGADGLEGPFSALNVVAEFHWDK